MTTFKVSDTLKVRAFRDDVGERIVASVQLDLSARDVCILRSLDLDEARCLVRALASAINTAEQATPLVDGGGP